MLVHFMAYPNDIVVTVRDYENVKDAIRSISRESKVMTWRLMSSHHNGAPKFPKDQKSTIGSEQGEGDASCLLTTRA